MAAPRNLLSEVPPGVDPRDLRQLLDLRIGGPGQYDGDSIRHLYLPQAREACRVVLVYRKGSLATLQRIERGPAFDEAQWQQILTEAQESLLAGPMKVGRDFCFSGRRVLGSWRGEKSGVQIFPPPSETPRAPVEMAEHPFVLECPLQQTREWPITHSRRLRNVRRLAMLLNVLLRARIRHNWAAQPDHLWVSVPGVDTRRFKFDRLRRWLRRPPKPPPPPRFEWAQEFFFAPLDPLVLDSLSQPSEIRIQEVPSAQYYDLRHPIFDALEVPEDLDESIVAYMQLREECSKKLNLSLYWLQLASRFSYRYMSASFVAMVSAIEALVETESHRGFCAVCENEFDHHLPGPTEAFRSFLDVYAPGEDLGRRRNEMYALRSSIVHGDLLMELDEERHSVWDPAWNRQKELWDELFLVTRTAVRNWLKDPQHADVPRGGLGSG